MELGGMGTTAAASDMTKISSGVGATGSVADSNVKKVLQFRLFKSLKQAGADFKTKYKVGRVLGKGSFGEVREVYNTQTGVTCAMKTVNRAHIGQHQVLVDLME